MINEALERLGVTSASNFTVLYVYVTDFTSSDFFDGIHIQFNKSPTHKYEECGLTGAVQCIRRKDVNQTHLRYSNRLPEPPERLLMIESCSKTLYAELNR